MSTLCLSPAVRLSPLRQLSRRSLTLLSCRSMLGTARRGRVLSVYTFRRSRGEHSGSRRFSCSNQIVSQKLRNYEYTILMQHLNHI